MKESSSSGTSGDPRQCSARRRFALLRLTTTSLKEETSKAKTFRTSRATLEDVARRNGSRRRTQDVIERKQTKLFELRERRVKPDRDEKIITAWNGLMLASFAEAGIILNRPDYTDAARRNAEFVLSNLRQDGMLLRTWKDGVGEVQCLSGRLRIPHRRPRHVV